MELFNHSQLKSEKFQFVGWVMGLGIGQTLAGLGDDAISTVVCGRGLVEDRTTSIGVQLEGLGKGGIGENRYCGTYALQFVKGLLASVVPSDGCPHLTCIFARCQFMQRHG